jgi:hypothetical protein
MTEEQVEAELEEIQLAKIEAELVDHETSVKKSESIKIPTNCSFKI